MLLLAMLTIVGLGVWRVLGARVDGVATREAECIAELDGTTCQAPNGGPGHAGKIDKPPTSVAPTAAAPEPADTGAGFLDGLTRALVTPLCAGTICLGFGGPAGPGEGAPSAPPAPAPLPADAVLAAAALPGPPPAGGPANPPPPGPHQAAHQQAMRRIFEAAPDNQPLRAALAHHVLNQPFPDVDSGVRAATDLTARARAGDEPAVRALSQAVNRPDLQQAAVADMASYVLVDAAQNGQAAKVVDELLATLRTAGNKDFAQLLATLGWAGRNLDAKDPRLAQVLDALVAGLDQRDDGGDASAIEGLAALFDRLRPQDLAALARHASPEAMQVLGAAEQHAKAKKELRDKLEKKLKSRQLLTDRELRDYLQFADEATGKLIVKYLRSTAFVADPPRMTEEEEARFEGWQAFPFDPKLADTFARMRQKQPLDGAEQKALFEAMRDVASRLREIEKKYPRYYSGAEMPKPIESEYWHLTVMLGRYARWRADGDAAAMKEIEALEVTGKSDEVWKALALRAQLARDHADLIVDEDNRKEALAKLERETRWRREDARDRDWDEKWHAMVAGEAARHDATIGLMLEKLKARTARRAAELDAADARGKDTDLARVAAAAELSQALDELRARVRYASEYLGKHKKDMRRHAETLQVRQTLEKLKHAEDVVVQQQRAAIERLKARPVDALFRGWGISTGEARRLSGMALGHHSPAEIAAVAARVRLVNTLPPLLRKELTGSMDPVDPIQVAQQLATGTLGHAGSSNKFLLEPLGDKLHQLRLAEMKRIPELKQELQSRVKNKNTFVGGVAHNTKEGFSFWARLGSLGDAADDYAATQRSELGAIRKSDEYIKKTFEALQSASGRLLFFELADDLWRWQAAKNAGRLRDADLALYEVWRKHGDALAQIDPSLYEEMRAAWKRLHAGGVFKTPELPDYRAKADDARRAAAYEALKRLDPFKADVAGVRSYALAALDQDPALVQLGKVASEAAGRLPTMMKLLEAAQDGKKYQDYVDYVREELARPILDLLEAPETKKAVEDAKQMLAQLEAARKTLDKRDDASRAELDARISALKAMIKLAEDPGIREALEIIMDKSKFNADTIGNWFRYQGPKVLGAIVVATLAAVTIVATGGGAAPLWAVALGASVGGYVGYQATAEGMYHLRNNFDPEVTSGKVKFGDRSALGAYIKGDTVYDPVKNEHVKMGFFEHVLVPAVKEIAVGFVLNFATMGLGRAGAGFINSALARASGPAAFLKHAARIKAVDARMSQIAKAGGSSPAAQELRRKLVAEISRKFPRELLDEIKDEAVEGALEQVLGAIDQRLTPLAALLNATGKGVNLKHGGNAELIKAVVDKLRVEGFEVDSELVDGKIRARMNGIELFIDGNGEVTMAEARGPPAAATADAKSDVAAQGAIRIPGDPAAEVANEYDLTPAEVEVLRAYYGDLQKVAEKIDADPVGAAADLLKLTGDPKWTGRMPFQVTDTLEITGREIDTLKARAKEYADQLKGELSEQEILEYLVREKFTGILRSNAGPGGTYHRNPQTGVVVIPKELVVRRDGEVKPLDPNDPVQKTLAQLHARALVEELAHGAGFSIRPGSYVPLSPRMADFQHWLKQPRTQEWLRASFSADEVARMESMIFEADAMDLFVRHSKYTDTEVERYEVRRAFQKFLDEGAPAAPPGTKTTPPADYSMQGAIRWLSSLFGGGKKVVDQPAKKEVPPPPVEVLKRLGPDGKPELSAIDAQGKEVPPDGYGTVYYGSSTETPEALTPEKVFEQGLPKRGTDRDLRKHAEAQGNSAFRGTTILAMSPDGEWGAALWAGPGGYVYEIDGVAGFDVNKHLERIPVSGGITRQNAVRGEAETAIPAEVPRERIKAAYQIIETPTGRLRLGPAIINPNYKPLGGEASGKTGPPADGQVQGAFDATQAAKLRGQVDELAGGRVPRDISAADLKNVQALALSSVDKLFTNQFGTDTALLEAVRQKKAAYLGHGADPAAWGGRSDAEQQRAALLVIIQTFQGTDAGDVALRKAALDKLGEIGRPGDVPALLRVVRNPKTSTDLHHGLEAIKAIAKRHGSPRARGDAEVQRRVGHLLKKETLTDAERAQVIEAVLKHGEIASVKQHKGTNMNEVYFVTFTQTVPGPDGKPMAIRGVFKPENTYPGKDKAFFGREVSAYLFDRDFAGTGKVPVTAEVVLSPDQAPRGGPQPLGTGSVQFMIPDAKALGTDATHMRPEHRFLVDDGAKSDLPAEVQQDLKKQLAEIRTLLYVLNDPDKLPDPGGFKTPNWGNIMIAADPARPGFFKLYMIDNGGGQGALGKKITPAMLPGEVPADIARRLGKADPGQVERTVAPYAADAAADVAERLRRASGVREPK